MFRSLTPLVIPQVFAPVMERERNHRKRRNRSPRPGRAPDQDWLLLRAPVRRPCRDAKSVMSNSGGYARAPPPANIHRPSGTKMHRLTCGETNGLRSPYHVRQDKGEEHGPNPPNGSWGIVKARPTPTKELSPNPPNGSWGIVKARPSPTAMSD